ncbi:MAG: rolling circle replication-associated protein [Ginsengibacter sp.]
MRVLKNSFGVSVSFIPKVSKLTLVNKLTGSSLSRQKREIPEYLEQTLIEKLLAKPLKIRQKRESDFKFRSMSPRTKSKIRKKVIAFSRQSKKLSFVTLTFLNKVTDRQAIKALGAFLDNVSKLSKDFQYLWVAEKQSKNEVFKDNIHFHLITNKFWKIERWWNYWLEVQKNQGIVPRDENFKPSSAFDVKVVNSNNIKGVGNYITKYITKNTGQYRCMVWNCSRKISQLYTDFYSNRIS